MKRKLYFLTVVIITICVALTFASCGFIREALQQVINDPTVDQNIDENELVKGSKNKLAVGFFDGVMTAFWDDYSSVVDFTLKITKNGVAETYTVIGNSFNLKEKGYTHTNDLALTLIGNYSDTSATLEEYIYYKITDAQYIKYTADFSGGWKDLDSYVATRAELFELFSYCLIFRPGQSLVTNFYSITQEFYVGYNFNDLYTEKTNEEAINYEIKSAVVAFEDSAGYTYSYTYNSNGVCELKLKFEYNSYPTQISTTNTSYTNAIGFTDKPHYEYGVERDRAFPIDTVNNTVVVNSSDQLYFALKKGYKPSPAIGSNAYYIYKEMRRILANINDDGYSDVAKVHNIYDYIINTVIYDYIYVEDILTNDTQNSSLFSYKCLYLEGVFGFENNKTFNSGNRVAICDGISKAVFCLATIEGIPTIKVSGSASGVAHAWNKVKVNNKWYLVDATWGNRLDRRTHKELLTHDYLLVSDDSLHIQDNWYSYPEANNGKYPIITV